MKIPPPTAHTNGGCFFYLTYYLAREGRVLVGAFVSEYEQQVRAVALREGHAVVQLTTDLLTDYYKPSGELFDACGRGQVLLLSQRTTLDSFSRRITRAECNTLNALAEEIAGVSLRLYSLHSTPAL